MDKETTYDYLRALGYARPSDRISRRSYRQLRDAVYELARNFGYQGSAEHAIFNIIRQRFGCRATEIRDGDLAEALDLVKELEPRVEEFRNVQADFEIRAIKQVFGAAGVAALENGAQEALSELGDPYELPEPPPIAYAGNVVRFPGNA